MLYCSIDEAWGNYFNINDEKPNNDKSEKNEKSDKPSNNNKKDLKKIVENFTESINEEQILSEEDCGKIIKHVMKCKKCQKKLKEMLTPKLISLLKNLLEDYRDLFVLLLVGISILLFFNLVSNLSN
jgi:hypothetical protein